MIQGRCGAKRLCPVAGFFEGFAGLAFAAGEDEPVGFGILNAVKDGFGGAGVVLAGLASPETDFETGVVFDPAHLILEEVVLKYRFDELLSVHGGWDLWVGGWDGRVWV